MKGAHRYLSTACYHVTHAECRRTCKYCGEHCVCPCHVNEVDPLAPEKEKAMAQAETLSLVEECRSRLRTAYEEAAQEPWPKMDDVAERIAMAEVVNYIQFLAVGAVPTADPPPPVV